MTTERHFPRDLLGLLTMPLWIVIAALLTDWTFDLLQKGGVRLWYVLYVIFLLLGFLGASMICWAKLPLYRDLRLFTLGFGSVPEERRAMYRVGYRFVLALFGTALILLLMSSMPMR